MSEDEDPDFDGTTYVREEDQDRLASQLEYVKAVMSDQQWHTLADIVEQIQARTGTEDIGVLAGGTLSSRVRDLRKGKFGGYVVNSRRRGGGGGLWEYQLFGEPTWVDQTGKKAAVITQLREQLREAEKRAKAYRDLCERAVSHYEKINCTKAAESLRTLMQAIEEKCDAT